MSALGLPLPSTIADHLAIAAQHVCPPLVSPDAWQTLRSIEDPLPPTADEAALEVRLAANVRRVDFTLCVGSYRDARRRLEAGVLRSGIATDSPRWRSVLSFAQGWADESSPLHDSIHALWLEFDADPTADGSPEPFLIFSIDGDRVYPGGRPDRAKLCSVLLAGIARINGTLDRHMLHSVERLVADLPRNAQLRHAAVRPTSRGDVVRLVVRIPRTHLSQVLCDLGWPGDGAGLDAVLQRLCRETIVHQINLDLLPDGLGPRVGIEFLHLGTPRKNARWRALFDQLEFMDACAPERRAALEQWGGLSFGGPLGPGLFVVRRDLLVKVDYETNEPLRAKAYLAFAPRLWVASEDSARTG